MHSKIILLTKVQEKEFIELQVIFYQQVKEVKGMKELENERT